MREQAEKLRLTLMSDGGRKEIALKEVLKSEIVAVLRQYMNIEDINIDISENGIKIFARGDGFKNVGFYCGE